MQNNDKQALDVLSDQIIKAIQNICTTLKFDRTYTGNISSVNKDGYTIKYNGTEINVKTKYTNVFKKNDLVKICIPCSNKQKAFIQVDLDLMMKINERI